MFRAICILFAIAFGGALRAHVVPQIIVEAEFSSEREALIKVNMDPRLFLSPQPTSLPPVPASWWFEQDEAAQQKTRLAAADYVARTFTFNIGTATMKGDWKVQPIDSTSAFPLGQASTETHLLVEHQGPLPADPGDFKLLIAKDCAVAVILLSGIRGEAERRPEALYGGESSRAFKLPPIPAPPPPKAAPTASFGSFLPFSQFHGEHLVLAALLGITMPRRWMVSGALLVAFFLVNGAAAGCLALGWLPPAPAWMVAAYWISLALAAAHLVASKPSDAFLYLTLSVAGFCHGLNTPGLLGEPSATLPVRRALAGQTAVELLWSLAVLALCVLAMHVAKPRSATAPHPDY